MAIEYPDNELLCYVGGKHCNDCLHITPDETLRKHTYVKTWCGKRSTLRMFDTKFTLRVFVHEPERICKTCLKIAKARWKKEHGLEE